jgi:signal transduction histidine kinase
MVARLEGHPFADLLARRKSEIEKRWQERVQTDGGDGVGLSGALSDYLEGLAHTLSHPHAIEEEAQVWLESAREHAVTRGRSFDVHAVIRELEILRDVLLEVALEEGMIAQPPFDEIVHALDVPIAATVSSYVQARDSEAKRSEAEHICFLTHELRNPLAVATLAAAQLRRMGLPTAVQERAAELVERSLQRLRALIESAAPPSAESWRAS